MSLLPSVRSTWAPRGQTPILRHRFNWKRASMAAACCYRADGTSAELVFGMRAGSYDEDSLIEFVGELHTHLAGKKVTLLWDGLPSHRSKKMKRYLASQRRWLVVEPYPRTLPSSTPSRSCGPTSRAQSWRTSAPRPWTSRSRRPTEASSAFAATRICSSLSLRRPDSRSDSLPRPAQAALLVWLSLI